MSLDSPGSVADIWSPKSDERDSGETCFQIQIIRHRGGIFPQLLKSTSVYHDYNYEPDIDLVS